MGHSRAVDSVAARGDAEEAGIRRQRRHPRRLDAAAGLGNNGRMDADALFALAAQRLRANRIAEARALFGQAGEAGSHEAAVIHCNLVAAGEDWGRGLALLRELAAKSGGQFLKVEDAGELLHLLAPQTDQASRPMEHKLWQSWTTLLIVLLLLTLEWVARKLAGLP